MLPQIILAVIPNKTMKTYIAILMSGFTNDRPMAGINDTETY